MVRIFKTFDELKTAKLSRGDKFIVVAHNKQNTIVLYHPSDDWAVKETWNGARYKNDY